MIVSAWLNIMYLLGSAFIALLPESDGLTASQESAFTNAFDFIEPFLFIIDITVVVGLIASALVLEVGLMVWYGVNWTIKKMPGMQ